MQTYNKPFLIERLLSAGSYLTAGGVGFCWLILAMLLRKQVRPFLMYHIMQSIFVSILFFLVSVFANFLFIIIAKIPLLNVIPYLINMPLSFALGFSLVQLFTTTIILYLAITSFLGYYSYLPWVSEVIKGNTSTH